MGKKIHIGRHKMVIYIVFLGAQGISIYCAVSGFPIAAAPTEGIGMYAIGLLHGYAEAEKKEEV